MTRFNITLSQGVDMVTWGWSMPWRRTFVPKIPSYRITDVAEAIGPCQCQLLVFAGEKIHEEMITASDSFNTFDIGPYYSILPCDVQDFSFLR